jgi:hypothetical protein
MKITVSTPHIIKNSMVCSNKNFKNVMPSSQDIAKTIMTHEMRNVFALPTLINIQKHCVNTFVDYLWEMLPEFLFILV